MSKITKIIYSPVKVISVCVSLMIVLGAWHIYNSDDPIGTFGGYAQKAAGESKKIADVAKSDLKELEERMATKYNTKLDELEVKLSKVREEQSQNKGLNNKIQYTNNKILGMQNNNSIALVSSACALAVALLHVIYKTFKP